MRKLFGLFASLRGRLVLLVCLATLPAALFTFFAAQNERSSALLRMEEDARHLSGLAAREHAHQIQGARQLLRWLGGKIAREGELSPVLKDPGYLPALLAGYAQLANIGVLSPGGKVLASAHPTPVLPDMADNPAFAEALRSQDVATGKYLIGPIVHRPVLNLAYAVRDGQGRVVQVVFNALDLRWLRELAEKLERSAEYSLLIADGNGRVLTYAGAAHAEIPNAVGVHIPEIAELANSSRGKLLRVGNTGVRRYFVAAPLAEIPGLFVAAGLSYERVYRRANAAFYRTLLVLTLITVFTIVSVLAAAEVVVLRSLRVLARTARRFGAGDLPVRAPVPAGYGELSYVATAFNSMADSLAARHAEAIEAQGRLRALSARLHVARETEAGRIARELHDEIGQVLTGLKIDLCRLPSRCLQNGTAASCAAELENGVAAMNGQIARAIDFTRRICTQLRPGVLDKLGLAAALEWQAHEIEQRTGLTIHVDAQSLEEPLDWLVSVTLFRIVQEALTNVVRHAEANVVSIVLSATGEAIVLTVEDDGKGIDKAAADRSDSLGILGMRERAMLVDGSLSIEGAPGQGTRVSVRVPRRPVPGENHAHSVGG